MQTVYLAVNGVWRHHKHSTFQKMQSILSRCKVSVCSSVNLIVFPFLCCRVMSVCVIQAGRGTIANKKLMNVYHSPAKTTPPAQTFSTATSRCASWLEGTALTRCISHLMDAEKESVQRWQYVLPLAVEIMNCRWQVKQMSQSMAHSMKRFQGICDSLEEKAGVSAWANAPISLGRR